MAKDTKDKRNHLIDLLRFFAAAWVALYHLNIVMGHIDNWYQKFCKYGYLGVPVFFVISGYCICIAQKHAKTPTDFIIRRFFRIMPPYWFSLLVVCVCILAMKIITGVNSAAILPKTPMAIFSTFVLCPSAISHVPYINWVYWTLPYEIFFYLLIFFTMYLPGSFRATALLLITLTAIVLPIQTTGVLFFMNELPTFMLGLALYSVIKKDKQLALSVLLLVMSVVGIYIKHPLASYQLIAGIVALLISWSHYKPLRANKISSLGDFSYSIYLIHVPVAIYLFGFVKQLSIVQKQAGVNILIDVLLLTLVIILAKQMYLYIELPAIQFGKKATSVMANH